MQHSYERILPFKIYLAYMSAKTYLAVVYTVCLYTAFRQGNLLYGHSDIFNQESIGLTGVAPIHLLIHEAVL
jgi:hypothetical protein